MKIQSIISKQTTLLLIGLLTLSTLFLPLTTLRAATLANGMNASYVLGAANFTTQTATSGQSGYYAEEPWMANDSSGLVFVSDSGGNRVLVFDISGGITNGMNASYVLGQDDFVSSATATSQDGFNGPAGVAYSTQDGGLLFVADETNNRVLVFDISGGITNGMNASYVLGQPDFVSNTATITQSGMNAPHGLFYVQPNLYVVDRSASRILVFNLSGGITNGMNASYVLGQPDFETQGGSVTQSTLQDPKDVSFYGTENWLFVADKDGNRVVVFDVSTITNGENAIYVLGQDDFVSSATTVDQGSTIQPVDVEIDGTGRRLFVGSSERGSVSVFDLSGGITNGMNASYVLGQPDFSTVNVELTQAGYAGPMLTYYKSEKLLFSGGEARILVYNLDPDEVLGGGGGNSASLKYTHPALCTATFSPNVITKGQSTTLSWNIKWPTERTSTYYTKVPKEGLYSDKVSSIQVQPGHTTNYRIAVFNLWGASFCESTITVLNKEGQEILPENPQNLTLSAGASNHPLVRPILSLFSWLFVR